MGEEKMANGVLGLTALVLVACAPLAWPPPQERAWCEQQYDGPPTEWQEISDFDLSLVPTGFHQRARGELRERSAMEITHREARLNFGVGIPDRSGRKYYLIRAGFDGLPGESLEHIIGDRSNARFELHRSVAGSSVTLITVRTFTGPVVEYDLPAVLSVQFPVEHAYVSCFSVA